MLKLICSIIISVSVLLTTCLAVEVSARSAILYEPETGTVLYSKDSETKREIASTTKIMTAVVVLENAELSDIVSVHKSCVGIEGTSMYLQENEKLSVSDLLYGLLLRSGNDAAVTLAYHVGNGDVSRFVDMMNETAERIGMKNTTFMNPNGLPADGHVSTAYDMAVLTAYAMNIPEFAEVVSTKEKTVAGRLLTNHNKLLRMYDGANGVKTGYTKAAGRCLVSSAERNGMSLIAVTLSAPDDWDDHANLLDFGFNNFSVYKSPKAGEAIAEVAVVGGENTNRISAVLAGEISLIETRGTDRGIKQEVYLPRFLYAPITRGDIIGEIKYVKDGEVIATASLVSCDSVGVYKKDGFFDRLFSFFRRT